MSSPQPLWRRIAWIAAAVMGVGVLGGAVALALEAQAEDEPPKLHVPPRSRRTRPSRATLRNKLRRAKLDLSRPATRPAARPFPRARVVKPRPKAISGVKRTGSTAPALGRSLPALRSLRRGPTLTGRHLPGRLSPEELAQRRAQRRARQIERLRKRIETLDTRIKTYREEGTRTEAQIERMERSLERMRTRLARMEEQQQDNP